VKRFFFTRTSKLLGGRSVPDNSQPVWLKNQGEDQSELVPMVQAGRMVRRPLVGIVNAMVLGATNAAAESINARIQRIKAMACGNRNRNRERFRNAILFPPRGPGHVSEACFGPHDFLKRLTRSRRPAGSGYINKLSCNREE
jgi:hypothetical protein